MAISALYGCFIVASTVFLATFLFFVQKFAFQCWSLRAYRGPFALPLIGNCYQPEALFLLRFLATLRKKYGKKFTFFAFTKPYLVVCDPLAVRRILSETKIFHKGGDYTELFSIAFGQGLVTSNGDKHKHDRGVLGKYFIRTNVAKYMPIANEASIEVMDDLFPSTQSSKMFNVENIFSILALRVFLNFSMGCDLRSKPEVEREICNVVSKGSYNMGIVVSLGLPPWSFMPPVKNVVAARDCLWSHFKGIAQQRRDMLARGEGKDIDDCLSAMLEENLNETEMCDHMVTLISAGHETSAYFSSYLSFLLATNQPEQDRLREEIYTVVGNRQEITADDISELKYLQKVMQETLRLYAIIPCVTRVATEEVHIKEANMTIPKGTDIMVPLFLINRDPGLWENPSAFNPDRFEAKADFTSAKNGFFPFGYGSRTCVGNTLAQMESAVFFCHLLRRFKLTPDPGFKPAILAGISLTTSNGINVVLERL